MAAQKITREYIARIEKAGGVAAVLDRVAGGETLGTIARGLGMSRSFLSGYMNSEPTGKEALRVARLASAQILAEEVLEIADRATPRTVKAARLQVELRKWLATRYGVDRGWSAPSAPDEQYDFSQLSTS
jgi:hypothetical protein